MSATILAATAVLAIPSASAVTRAPIYNNIPSPLPGNVPSVGFEATPASEFGGQVELSATARTSPSVTVVMSSWGCQSGTWNTHDCSTTPGVTFTQSLTLNFYQVGANGQPGNPIASVTHTFTMPYRPSADFTHCTGADAGKWYSKANGTCYNGKAFTRKFSLGASVVLPDDVIISIAYNTTHYGDNPIGESATCYGTSAGCGYPFSGQAGEGHVSSRHGTDEHDR